MIPGLRVGHWQRIGDGWLTGTTVVLPDAPALAAVDVRGGGPATRDTIALRPGGPRVDAIVLTGGSAHGLAAADGVQEWLGTDAPLVPAAAIYDLGRGGVRGNRPDAAAGRAAAAAAGPTVAQGCVGAGTGAVTAEMKGGLGTASVTLPGGSVVGALAVVNAHGSTLDPATGLPLAAGLGDFGLHPPDPAEHAAAVHALQHPDRPLAGLDLPNTVIGVVATDAPVDHAGLTRAAGAAQRGMARAIRPVHGATDGDTVFALSTGVGAADPALTAEVALAAELTFARAVVHAILAATSVTTGFGHIASYRELYPGAVAGRPAGLGWR